MKRHALLVIVALLLAACGGAAPTADTPAPGDGTPSSPPLVERVAELERMPSGVAVFGDRVFLSLPRWVEVGDATVVELVDGALVPYPSGEANDVARGPGALHSVNGLHIDERGWLWILDNARIDLGPAPAGAPKLVVWDTVREREVFRHVFDPEVAPPGASFLNDVVVDRDHGFAFVTQSGMGGTPGLISFEIHRDIARRVLDGHHSVVPDAERDMVIDGEVVLLHRPSGPVPWRVAANSIAISPDGDTLFFGAMSSDSLYEVPTRVLRDASLDGAEVSAAVETWGPKPISDGICTTESGRILATDVENSRVVELTRGGKVEVVRDPRLSFPVACEVVGDTLWLTTNQLHRAPLLGGDDRREPPYGLWRVRIDR